MHSNLKPPWLILALGDLVILGAVTVIGFVSHGEPSNFARMLATFLPLCAGWALAAPWLGLFDPSITHRLAEQWRPWLAVVLAVPLAILLRGLWLSEPVLPVFGLVLIAASGLGLFLWRCLYALVFHRQVAYG